MVYICVFYNIYSLDCFALSVFGLIQNINNICVQKRKKRKKKSSHMKAQVWLIDCLIGWLIDWKHDCIYCDPDCIFLLQPLLWKLHHIFFFFFFFLGFIYFTSIARARMLCESFSTVGYNLTCKVLDLGGVWTRVAQVSGTTRYRIAPPSRTHLSQ